MKPSALAIALTAVIAFTVLPVHWLPHTLLGVTALLLAIGLTFLLVRSQTSQPPVSTARAPVPAPETKGSAEAEVIAFLAQLQKRGRFIDFLMDDISAHDDATVGAVARVVYQGCREVLLDHLRVVPLCPSAEGSAVTVPSGYRATEYELVGKLGGTAPFTGVLEHKGWKVESIKLPRVFPGGDGELPPLAPAQVTLR